MANHSRSSPGTGPGWLVPCPSVGSVGAVRDSFGWFVRWHQYYYLHTHGTGCWSLLSCACRLSPILSTRLPANEWHRVSPVLAKLQKGPVSSRSRRFLLFFPTGIFPSFPTSFYASYGDRCLLEPFLQSIYQGFCRGETHPYLSTIWVSNLLPIMGNPSLRLSSRVLRPPSRTAPSRGQ